MRHAELVEVLQKRVIEAQRELCDVASALEQTEGFVTSEVVTQTSEVLRSSAKLCGLLMEVVEKYSAGGLS